MTPVLDLHLSWVPGTSDQVRFQHLGRTFTVFLKDVQRANAHSLGALYLTGRVALRITREHHAQLTGRLAHTVTGVRSTAPVDSGPAPANERPGTDDPELAAQ